MVLETIDDINELTTINGPKQGDPCSPLSVSTQGSGASKHAIASPTVQESRDAAVATPCESIRMYANELAPSKSVSAASSGNQAPCDSIRDTPCDSIRDYANELTASKSRSRSDIGEDALPPKAMLVPAAAEQREGDHEASAALVPLAVVLDADPLTRTISARSELSQGSGAARPTLITVTNSDEGKLEMNEKSQRDGEELQPSDSVEVVAMREEAVPTEEDADAEAKPATIEVEPVEEKPVEEKPVEEKPVEAKLVEEDAQFDAAKEKLVEEETTLVEDKNKPEEDIAADGSEVKASASTEEQGRHGQQEVEKKDEESQPAADASVETPPSSDNDSGKKKKFGLKFSKPNMHVRSPIGKMSITKGLSKPDLPKPNLNLAKPNLSKPNLSKSNKPGNSKPQRSMRFTKPSLGKRSKNKVDPASTPKAEPKTTTPPETVSSPEEPKETTEEHKEATVVDQEDPTSPAGMETIDLNDECKKAESSASSPLVEIEHNTAMEVNQAEMLDATKEENDDEASLPKVQVTPQVTELVTKGPETEALEATAAVTSDAALEGGGCGQNILESWYNKVEECFGDVTNLCGPKAKSKTVTEEAEADKTSGDAIDDAKKCTTTTTTPAPDAGQDSKPDEQSFPELMTPLSVMTEHARSFVVDIAENPSIKSIVDSAASAAQQVEDTIFATNDAGSHGSTSEVDLARNTAPSAEKAEQDKLDKAAEMAKKALDEGAGAADKNNSEGTSDKKGSTTAPKSKRFGLTGKSQLKMFAQKSPAAAPKQSAQAEKMPAVATSPSKLFSIKRGFSTRTKSGAGKTKLEADSAVGKAASDSKKPAPSRFLRFKKPAGLVARVRSNSKALSHKSEAEAMSILSQEEVLEDLKGSTSMNSQSLNEPQSSIVGVTMTVPEGDEETHKVDETPKQEESHAVDENLDVTDEPAALAVDEPVAVTSELAVAADEPKSQESIANISELDEAAEILKTQTPADEESKEQETPPVDEPEIETQQ